MILEEFHTIIDKELDQIKVDYVDFTKFNTNKIDNLKELIEAYQKVAYIYKGIEQ